MNFSPELLATIAIVSIVIIAVLIIGNYILDSKKVLQKEKESQQFLEEVKNNINSNDIGKTMNNFFERRKLLDNFYYSILKKATVSFYVSLLMAIIGFGVIIYQIFITTSQSEDMMNYIKMISSIVIEVVSVFFIAVFKNVAKRQDKAMIEIHVADKLITRIDLIYTLSDDKREELIIEIIKELKN